MAKKEVGTETSFIPLRSEGVANERGDRIYGTESLVRLVPIGNRVGLRFWVRVRLYHSTQ